MPFKPNSVIVDNSTGWFEMAIHQQTGDSPKGEWGLQWGPISGGWRRDVSILREITKRWGINVGVGGHLEPKFINETVGRDKEGKPIKDKRPVGWKLSIPGQGQEKLFVPFDEVYHMVALANEVGTNPPRQLFTNPHLHMGYRFEAKSRKSVKGPLTNPTFDSIIKAVPQGITPPKMFLIVGEPGVGKTTLFGTFPAPILVIDLQGGCEELAKRSDCKVIVPNHLDEVFNPLRTLRDKGELPD